METLFEHERLEVYRLARQANREVSVLTGELAGERAASADELVRASKSIPRHIADGAGRWRFAEKIHSYHQARAAGTACASALDELCDYGVPREDRTRAAKTVLARLVGMLTAMIRSLEARQTPASSATRSASPRTAARAAALPQRAPMTLPVPE